ncbi:hypothetical protein BJ166DRAFT_491002 [Pestalotiopsis sp. NC0098]|nr:hypothetical protein BJ166DRAFT_491002 [Pestalotiopsis sp. NC0098]
MSGTSSTIPPDRFDYFPKLPREIQLLVWGFYEADCLKIRHVFSYYDFDRFKYKQEVQESWRRVWSTKESLGSGLIDFSAVDSAVASRYEIPLPRHTRWKLDIEDVGRDVNTTWSQHTWMNFKLDSFCFHPVEGAPKMSPAISRILTGYFPSLKRDRNFMDPRTLKFNLSHWFFRIQHLELHFHNPHIPLGEIDKLAIELHPSLKTISLVVEQDDLLIYSKSAAPAWSGLRFVAREINIVSNDAGVILSKAREQSSYAGEKTAVVAKLLEFQQEVRNLMKHRVVFLPPLIQIKIKGFYCSLL